MVAVGILKLTKKDVQRIVDLDRVCFGQDYDMPPVTKEKVEEILKKGFVFGIKENKKLVSNIQVEYKEKEKWFIYGIATHPEKQKQGLADKLLKKVLGIAREKNIKEITVTVKPENEKSNKLFAKNGFKKIKIIKNYWGKEKERILMQFDF